MTQTLQAFLGPDSFFDGKVCFSGEVRIDGRFRGEVEAEGMLIVGEAAVVEARISVGGLIVHGKVVGDIEVKERVEVGPTGRLAGTLTTPRMHVHEGAQLEVKVRMSAPHKEVARASLQVSPTAPPPSTPV